MTRLPDRAERASGGHVATDLLRSQPHLVGADPVDDAHVQRAGLRVFLQHLARQPAPLVQRPRGAICVRQAHHFPGHRLNVVGSARSRLDDHSMLDVESQQGGSRGSCPGDPLMGRPYSEETKPRWRGHRGDGHAGASSADNISTESRSQESIGAATSYRDPLNLTRTARPGRHSPRHLGEVTGEGRQRYWPDGTKPRGWSCRTRCRGCVWRQAIHARPTQTWTVRAVTCTTPLPWREGNRGSLSIEASRAQGEPRRAPRHCEGYRPETATRPRRSRPDGFDGPRAGTAAYWRSDCQQ